MHIIHVCYMLESVCIGIAMKWELERVSPFSHHYFFVVVVCIPSVDTDEDETKFFLSVCGMLEIIIVRDVCVPRHIETVCAYVLEYDYSFVYLVYEMSVW